MYERLVLALDGSTGVCSAALLRMIEPRAVLGDMRPGSAVGRGGGGEGGPFQVVAWRSEPDGRAQARALLVLVDEMLEQAGRRPEDLGAVVVGRGPGTFTGVRVTVATARALSLALGTPVAGVSTLGALAAVAASEVATGRPTSASKDAAQSPSVERAKTIVPVVEARRGQLFYGLYRPTEADNRAAQGLWARTTEFGVCDRGELGDVVAGANTVVVGEEVLRPEKLPPGVVFVGRDAAAQYLVIGQDRLEEPGRLPEGSRLTGWLREALVTGGTTSAGEPAGGVCRGSGAPGTPESVTPIYVRSPDADIHITRMRDPWADGSSGR